LNNLSADHNLMRPSMLQTGLEAIGWNLNRKNQDLRFFEFGKTYHKKSAGNYQEQEHLCLYVTGSLSEDSWKRKAIVSDLYYLKGVVARILQVTGIDQATWQTAGNNKLDHALEVMVNKKAIIKMGAVSAKELKRFDIKQQVYYADLDWELILQLVSNEPLKVADLPKQLPVRRDLAMIVSKALPFADVESTVKKVKLDKLQDIQLFDIFESEKLGAGKKSLALSFTFLDREKTPTDKEIDAMMHKIMAALETELQAEIRK
jgi:phenylalanyl-tRNA synthetase beta chain